MSSDINYKILDQVEHYFGDRNLPNDKFIKEVLVYKHNGWMPIEILITKFYKMKSILANVEQQNRIGRVAEAVSNSDLIELNYDKTQLRRNPNRPLPMNLQRKYNALSRYLD